MDESIELLTREYLDGDSKSTATLGFAHAWRLAESGRVEDGPARVIESADLAVRYFYESSQEFPTDPRLKRFWGVLSKHKGRFMDIQNYKKKVGLTKKMLFEIGWNGDCSHKPTD